MTQLADEIGALALELAHGLWSELGADGAAHPSDARAIDLEPLLMYTAWIGSTDEQLHSRSLEWSIANVRLASAIRMRNLLRPASSASRASFERYAATVKAHTDAPWPAKGDPLPLAPSSPIEGPDLRRPSLLQLRIRALFGVSARAEILRLLIAEPDRPMGAARLSEGAAFGKVTISQALGMLTMTGLVQVQPSANRLVYGLARPAEIRQLLQPLPASSPDWAPIFRITESIADYARSSPSSSAARMAGIRSLLRTIDDDVRRLGIAAVVPRLSGVESADEFERWALTFVRATLT